MKTFNNADVLLAAGYVRTTIHEHMQYRGMLLRSVSISDPLKVESLFALQRIFSLAEIDEAIALNNERLASFPVENYAESELVWLKRTKNNGNATGTTVSAYAPAGYARAVALFTQAVDAFREKFPEFSACEERSIVQEARAS